MLSKSKKISVLSASDSLQDTEGWALLYSCATDWWMLFPRKTESTWVISRKQSIDSTIFEKLKSDVGSLLDGSYDVADRWGSHTVQGGDCKYNPLLTQQRITNGDNSNDNTPPTPTPPTPTPTPPTPDPSDNGGGDDTNPLPVPDPQQDKGSTSPTDDSGSSTLILIIGILAGLLISVIIVVCIYKKRQDKDTPDQQRLLGGINGSVSVGGSVSR